MKKTTCLATILVLSLVSAAQKLPDFDSITLNRKEDYDSSANQAALIAATYMLSTPIDPKDKNRTNCERYLLEWMSGTPDYSFKLNLSKAEFLAKDNELLMTHMASLCKYALENPGEAKDQRLLQLNALRITLLYAKDPKNKVEMTNELKKAIKAEGKGQLQQYTITSAENE